MPLFLDYIDKREDGSYSLKQYFCEYDPVTLIPIVDNPRYKPKKLKKRIDDVTAIVEKHYVPVTFTDTARADIKKRSWLTRWMHKKEDNLIFEGKDCLDQIVAEDEYKKRKVGYFNLEFQTADGAIRGEIMPGDHKNLRLKFKMELILATVLLGVGAVAYNQYVGDAVGSDTVSQLVEYVNQNYNLNQIYSDLKQFWGDMKQADAAKPIHRMLSWLKSASYWTYGIVVGNYLRRIVHPYIIDNYNGMKIELSPLKTSFTEEEALKYKALCHDLTMYNADSYTFNCASPCETLWQSSLGWLKGRFKALRKKEAPSPEISTPETTTSEE